MVLWDGSSLFAFLQGEEIPDRLLFVNGGELRFDRSIHASESVFFYDWDDTMTGPGKKNRSWILLRAALESAGMKYLANDIETIRQKYRKIEDVRSLTMDEHREWHCRNLDIYAGSGLTFSDIEKQVGQDAEMHADAVEVLRYLLKEGAKVCIISAGIKVIIEMTLRKHGIDPDGFDNLEIFAVDIYFDGRGELSGYDASTLITAKEKSEIAKRFSVENGIRDKNVFAVGDGNTDYEMLSAFSSEASMILFRPSHKRKEMSEEMLNSMMTKVHAVCVEDFSKITEVFKKMII